MGKKTKTKVKDNNLAVNRKAYHDFLILEKLEVGIELKGTEVKSCKARNISLVDSYAAVKYGELFLYNVHIAPYEHGNIFNHDPKRARKLLMHKKEILRLGLKVREKGLTLIPLRFYLKRGKIKVELALAKGKSKSDKREALKEKSDKVVMDSIKKRFF